MANYLVLYNITKDPKSILRIPFVEKLELLGLKTIEHQSANYGYYEGSIDNLTRTLEELKDDMLKKEDKVTIYYADSFPVNSYSVFQREI